MHEDLIQLPTLPCPDKDSSWRQEAKCLGADTETFYPGKGGNMARAKLICYGCPVRKPCGEFATNNGLRDGIFGGLSDKERKQVRKGARTYDVPLSEVLRCSYYAMNNAYPPRSGPSILKFTKDVIRTASESTGLPMSEIYSNLDNASNYII